MSLCCVIESNIEFIFAHWFNNVTDTNTRMHIVPSSLIELYGKYMWNDGQTHIQSDLNVLAWNVAKDEKSKTAGWFNVLGQKISIYRREFILLGFPHRKIATLIVNKWGNFCCLLRNYVKWQNNSLYRFCKQSTALTHFVWAFVSTFG